MFTRRVVSLEPGCFVILLAFISGCGSSPSGPPLHPVSGTVKLGSEPLSDAQVIFTPKGGGATAMANTDSGGRYTLEYTGNAKGVPVGEYAVSISTFRPEPEVTDGAPSPPAAKERVPMVYNQKTTLVAKVPGDAGAFDFNLNATAGKVTEPPVPRGNN
ncbi:MAG TPA: carboxypeptidase-like regulatory domain-containing protein [Caulifigura sp.]|nr:carboxypeptidase-like regulatory domain-containing protein [Caulifigura sp.]